MQLRDRLGIHPENIHFELALKNKNVDLGVIEKDELKMVISIRSQSSSIRKNFTNNINGLQGEIVGLKNIYPNIVAGVLYLLKKRDLTDNYDCLEYYLQNIPRKLLPIISGAKVGLDDCFDTGSIIIWDLDENDRVSFLTDNYISQTFSIDNFFDDLREHYSEIKLKSQFNLNQLDSQRFSHFLGPKE